MDRIEPAKQALFFKKAEKSDTHDYIKGHDPDYHKNSRDKNNANDPDAQDTADISIESIIIFLEGLKKNTDGPDQSLNPISDSKVSKALAAYGVSKPKVKKRFTYLDDDHQDVDIKTVNFLIESLQKIIDQGYDHIILLKGNGFLDSIQKTVEKINAMQ
jgi:hypothetical protein